MLNEVTRLTKGDFSKFKEKKYQVERVRFSGLSIVKKGVVATFDTRDKAIDFLKKHESVSPSHFEENAKWRKENKERVKKHGIHITDS